MVEKKRTKIVSVGTGHYLLIPKKYVDVYEMMDFMEDYEYEVDVKDEGALIIYRRVRKPTNDSGDKKEEDDNK